MGQGQEMDFIRLSGLAKVGFDGATRRLGEGLDAAISRVATAVARTGAKGKVTLTLDFDSDERDVLTISADIKTKVPEPGAVPIQGYIDRAGRLVDEDPYQGRLNLTSIDEKSAGGER